MQQPSDGDIQSEYPASPVSSGAVALPADESIAPAWRRRLSRGSLAYLVALIGPVPALLLTRSIDERLATFPVTLLIVAVMASAYLGGVGPGLLATFVSVAGATYLFTLPDISRPSGPFTDDVRLVVFVVAGLVVSVLSEQLRRARARALAYAAEVERQNKVLADQAIELEMQQQQLQEQAVELETANEHLSENALELEFANDELQLRAAELEVERAAAERANHAKGQFLANMSHELRTPLNAIEGYVQLLEMGVHGPISGVQRQTLERIAHAQRYLLGLIDQILDYAAVEKGRVSFQVAPADLGSVVREVTPMIEPQFTTKGISYDVRLPPGELRVCADAEKLRRVLINLLGNAAKFTPAGGKVTVDVARRPENAGVVYLRVSDTGIGIARSSQDELFRPFVQVHDAQSSGVKGTGLGLAISRELARGMGGDLRVRSRDGEGSTFTVTLRADAECDRAQAPSP